MSWRVAFRKNWKKHIRHWKKRPQGMMELLQLPIELLERIVNKLEWQSYFRLQQTSHDMADFIRTCRVKVCLPDDSSLNVTVDIDGHECRLIREYHYGEVADFNSLYGARFNGIIFYEGRDSSDADGKSLTECCSKFKKYRITAKEINTTPLKDYTNEQYKELLEVLKPKEIVVQIRRSTQVDLLFTIKSLKKLNIDLGLADLQSHLDMFLTKFRELYITVSDEEMTSYFTEIKRILQHLREPPPNLHSLTFRGRHTPHGNYNYSTEELLEKFRDFNPTVLEVRRQHSDYRPHHVFECQLGLENYICRLEFGLWHTELSFKHSLATV